MASRFRSRLRAALLGAGPVLRVVLAAVPILGLGGCGKSKKPPPPAVVECQPFCHKTFETCGREVFIASGKLNVDKAKVFNVLGVLERVKAEGLEKCRKSCDEQQGLFADAQAVNDCMKIDDCEKFASCIVKVVK